MHAPHGYAFTGSNGLGISADVRVLSLRVAFQPVVQSFQTNPKNCCRALLDVAAACKSCHRHSFFDLIERRAYLYGDLIMMISARA